MHALFIAENPYPPYIFQTSFQSLETPTAIKKYRNKFIAHAELEVIAEN